MVLLFGIRQNRSLQDYSDKHPHALPTHLAFLPSHKGEISLTLLITPITPGQAVEDDGVCVVAVVETGVQVHRDVLRIMTDVDGKAAVEAETQRSKSAMRKGKSG